MSSRKTSAIRAGNDEKAVTLQGAPSAICGPHAYKGLGTGADRTGDDVRNLGIWMMILPLALGACAGDMTQGGGSKPVPEAVAAIAGPGQDVASARVMPEDGCYWYRHAGPVETTWLPLRTADGRPICTRAPE